MQYVAYYRVSTQKQGQSGLGLEAQRRAVLNYARCDPIAEFTEVESGKRDDRPELAKAIQYASTNRAVLVIAKLDRLSRDVYFISGLLKSGVPIKAADIPNADNFQFHIMAAVAEKEREMISERTKVAIAAKRARGEAWGTNQRRSTEANAYAAQLASTIAEIRADGAMEPAQIAAALNARGISTARGGQWGIGQVIRLLRRIDP